MKHIPFRTSKNTRKWLKFTLSTSTHTQIIAKINCSAGSRKRHSCIYIQTLQRLSSTEHTQAICRFHQTKFVHVGSLLKLEVNLSLVKTAICYSTHAVTALKWPIKQVVLERLGSQTITKRRKNYLLSTTANISLAQATQMWRFAACLFHVIVNSYSTFGFGSDSETFENNLEHWHI